MITLNQLQNIISGCGNLVTIRLFSEYKKELQLISRVRTEICESCSLYKNGNCNSELNGIAINDFKYYHENRVKGRTYNGCGCNMECKTLVPDENCPLGKWLSTEI